MKIVNTVSDLRRQLTQWRRAGQRIVFVPTMGNLHEGHFALIDLARRHGDRVVSSIFVNPKQFGPNEDYLSYPRTPASDEAGLASRGCDLLFSPPVEEMYPAGGLAQVEVRVLALADILCGAFRPGHFTGVATVVAKLFHLVAPDVAVFGEKDYQQLMVIRHLVRDLSYGIEIVPGPTVREANGLAMSSRNQYLSPAEREQAAEIYRTLQAMRAASAAGQDPAAIEAAAVQRLSDAGFRVDYAALRCADSLAPAADHPLEPRVALIAARLGKARLIDNLLIG